MTRELQLALLGKLEIRRDEAPLAELNAAKAQALLCYLAVTGRPHFRPTLAGLLWGDMPETNARANLRRELSSLRMSVGAHLVITRQEVAFDRDAPYWLDVEQFEWGVSHLASELDVILIDQLRQAVDLYRGDFLEGFYVREAPAFEEWALVQRTRLRELALAALYALSAHCAGLGQAGLAEGIAVTRRLLALEPSREEAHRRLMQLLALSGQRGAALAQYEVCRQALAGDLGVEPGPETQELYAQIREGEVRGVEPPAPPVELESAAEIPHNLPSEPTPFIGRETELADLDALLADPGVRLVTIVGQGGIGKTRLALACAERQLRGTDQTGAIAAGVFFVPLASVNTSEAMVSALAQACQFQLQEDKDRAPGTQLLDYLRAKRMLLVLDNLEQLLSPPLGQFVSQNGATTGGTGGEESGAHLIAEILGTAPDVKLLVTSRERLNLQQEQVYPLRGLPFPAEDTALPEANSYAAVGLFLQSARRVAPDFELTAEDLADLRQVCALVEGMPLGIELAAAWVDVLSLGDIAREVQGSLDFLETEWRDVPARHRSMQAVIEASWGQLDTATQRIFRQLSVFRGGFTRQAAREVAGASLRTLTHLVNKTLLLFERRQERYQVHELLRRYGGERLADDPGEEAAVADAHSATYCAALGRWEEDLKGARQRDALAEVEAELDNVRVAWEWALRQGQVARLKKALGGLCLYYDRPFRPWEAHRVYQSVFDRFPETEGMPPETLLLRARALAWQAHFRGQAAFATAPLLQQSQELLNSPILSGHDVRAERAFLLTMMPGTGVSSAFSLDVFEQRRSWLEHSLALWQELDDRWAEAHTRTLLAHVLGALGDADQARMMYAESLATFRALGDQWMVNDTLQALGHTLRELGYWELAEQALSENLTLAQAQGDRGAVAGALGQLHYVAVARGEFETALQHAQASVKISRETGNRYGLALGLIRLGEALKWTGEFERARAAIEDALPIIPDLALTWDTGWFNTVKARIELAAGRYQAARTAAQTAIATARKVGVQGMVAENLRLVGSAALAEGRYEKAQRALLEAMAAVVTTPDIGYTPRILAALGRTEYALGKRSKARAHLFEALETAVTTDRGTQLLSFMPLIAVVLAGEEDASLKERAVELYAVASSQPFVGKSPFFEEIAGKYITAAANTLPSDVVEAAQACGRALDWWETAEVLLDELRGLGWNA